ncbi:transposase [Thermus thermophilus]|nr:transposase [Thermus thermophilus]
MRGAEALRGKEGRKGGERPRGGRGQGPRGGGTARPSGRRKAGGSRGPQGHCRAGPGRLRSPLQIGLHQRGGPSLRGGAWGLGAGGDAWPEGPTHLRKQGEVPELPREEGFKPLPKRWVVGRTFAWLGRNRRLAKDYEQNPRVSEAWVYLGMLRLLVKRLARAA